MLTHSRLLELLSYDPETGEFRWKVDKGGIRAGSIAGCKLGDHYRQIAIDGEKYSSHRLAWFYMTAEWPKFDVDHKEHSEGDKFSNLRSATDKQNRYNTAPKMDGHSKWKGVTFDKGRKKCWKMKFVKPDGTHIQHRYEDEREAAEEYMFLALEHHGEFVRFE